MKKTIAGILITTVAFTALATGASAARTGRSYADNNNDGICDNRTSVCTGTGFTDADNDGICDNRTATGTRTGFTDADNDGICDNRTANTPRCPQNGTGMQRGRRNALRK